MENQENNSQKPQKPKKPKKGAVLELSIDSLSFGGPGIARTEGGLVVFVRNAIPGDRVTARVVKRKKDFLEARLLDIIEPSLDRIEPRCEHFGICGGCKWQNYPYELQLEAKSKQVTDHLERIAHIPDPPVEPIAGMEHPWEYRNKMEFTFSAFGDDLLKLGLHQPGFFDRIIQLDKCHIMDKAGDEARNATLEFCRDAGLSHHHVKKHEGLLRNLVLRKTAAGIMACIVTHSKEFEPHAESFVKMLVERVPQVKSIIWFVNELLSGVAIAGESTLLYGDPFLEDTVAGNRVKVSPASFMQTNTEQCEMLYSILDSYADLDGTETVFDLYTGMAPIAMMLSRRAGRVTGIESNPQAVADGRENLVTNGITNVELIEGEVEKILPDFCKENKPDVVVADPPRAGIHAKGLAAIIGVRPRKMIYVSCNPSTLARDAEELIKAGYTLNKVRPVDMFPHTAHIECIAEFTT